MLKFADTRLVPSIILSLVLAAGCVTPNLGNKLKETYTIVDATGGAEDPEFDSQLLAILAGVEGITPQQLVALAAGMQFTSIEIKGSYPPGTKAEDRAGALYDWLNSRMEINIEKKLDTTSTAEAVVQKVQIQSQMVKEITLQAVSGILNLLGKVAPELLADSMPALINLSDQPMELLEFLQSLLTEVEAP